MKVLLSTGSLYHLSYREIFATSQKCGFDGIELIMPSRKFDLEAMAAISEEYEQVIYSVHAPFIINFLKSYVLTPKKTLENVVHYAVSAAEELNASILTVHPPLAILSKARAESTMSEILSSVDSEVKIAVENMPLLGFGRLKLELHPLGKFEELKRFCLKNSCYATLDTAHCITGDVQPLEAYKILDEAVINIHLSDARNKKEGFPLGTGEIDFESFFKGIKSEYSGFLTLELSPGNFRGIEDLEKCRNFIDARLG